MTIWVLLSWDRRPKKDCDRLLSEQTADVHVSKAAAGYSRDTSPKTDQLLLLQQV
jgi:hypothetical protein